MARKRKAVTVEASNDEGTPRAKSRPRKKQAVTKTHNTAIKALIRKNAATSPLLLLPSEVRENILIHLVGDNLIHVKYLEGYKLRLAIAAEDEHHGTDASKDGTSEDQSSHVIVDPDNGGDEDDDDGGIAAYEARLAVMRAEYPPPTFRHAICVADQSEQSAYQEAISGHAVVPEGESPEFYVAPCKERHATCKMCGSGSMFLCEEDRQTLRVDLNVLGVCRQLYEEANHLLWATNTFSFDDPKTLEKFFGSLNPAQKRNLTNIHISTDIGGYYSGHADANYRTRRDSNYWGRALKLSYLNILRGVQALHLCLNQGFECFHTLANDSAEMTIEAAQQADLEPLLRLRSLSVKDVTVIVSDDGNILEKNRKSVHRWTATKKMEYAETIRVQLMDPGGAELVKTEAEAASLARKTEMRDNAGARLKSCKKVLKARHTDMIRSAKGASLEEAKAVSAAQEADRVSKKDWKKAAKLQDAAETQKEVAARARSWADLNLNNEKSCQKQVANAREKYKRAMARLGATPEEIEDEEELERLMEGLSDSDMDVEEDDMAPAHLDVQSEDDEPLASHPEEETSDEDDEGSA